MRRAIKWFLPFMILFGAALFSFSSSQKNQDEDCPFCNAKVLDLQKFYEDDLVVALLTHKPIVPGHCLIIPKRHVERFEGLSENELMQIGQVIKKVDMAAQKVFKAKSYLLLQKNGKEAGQTVPHVHFHYIPRQEGDDSVIGFMIRMYMANLSSPIKPDVIHKMVEEMQMALEP